MKGHTARKPRHFRVSTNNPK